MPKNKLLIAVFAFALLGLLFGAFVMFRDGAFKSPRTQEPREIAISGNIVCLPKDGNIVTMECAMGLVDVNNNYYELTNASRDTEISNTINDGGRVFVSGTITVPAKSKYKVVGSIEVKTIKSLK